MKSDSDRSLLFLFMQSESSRAVWAEWVPRALTFDFAILAGIAFLMAGGTPTPTEKWSVVLVAGSLFAGLVHTWLETTRSLHEKEQEELSDEDRKNVIEQEAEPWWPYMSITISSAGNISMLLFIAGGAVFCWALFERF